MIHEVGSDYVEEKDVNITDRYLPKERKKIEIFSKPKPNSNVKT